MRRRSFVRGGLKAGFALLPLARVADPPGVLPKTILVGAQAERGNLENPAFATLIQSHFRLITPGNEFKWARVHPAPESYNFKDADWVVDFCESRQMQVHGHNLCWVSANPLWMDRVITKETAAFYLAEHIRAVVGRYKGRVRSWDVVNEPLDSRSPRSDGLKDGIWPRLLGQEYIDLAFKVVAASDPAALRILNIYQVEQDYSEASKMRYQTLSLIRSLLARHVPIQAVGLQSHLDGNGSFAGTARTRFLRELQSYGLKILVTECDVDDTRLPSVVKVRDELVARAYRTYLKDVLENTDVKTVIFWTPCDKGNWYDAEVQRSRKDMLPHRPGLWDEMLQPKPACAVVDELRYW